jgi:hypothetical protein
MEVSTVTPYKFKIGQLVDFGTKGFANHSGPYEILRILPAENAQGRAYRIKSRVEPFERVAAEHEIVAVR